MLDRGYKQNADNAVSPSVWWPDRVRVSDHPPNAPRLDRRTARVMAKSPARTVNGISHDAALSDGHQSQYGHDGARSPATGFSHCAAAGGARRSHNFFRGQVSSKHAQRACVHSQRDQPRCETPKELFRQARQGTSLRAKSVSVALLAPPFVAY